MLLQQSANQAAIANVTVHKFTTTIRRDRLQIAQVPRVGQFVEVDYRRSSIPFQLLQDEVRPDEPRPASDQNRILHEWLIVIKKDGLSPSSSRLSSGAVPLNMACHPERSEEPALSEVEGTYAICRRRLKGGRLYRSHRQSWSTNPP